MKVSTQFEKDEQGGDQLRASRERHQAAVVRHLCWPRPLRHLHWRSRSLRPRVRGTAGADRTRPRMVAKVRHLSRLRPQLL